MKLGWMSACSVVVALSCGCGGGGGGGGGSGGGGAGTLITVSGQTASLTGQPYPFVTVIVRGHDPVLSDFQGQFTVANVAVPYDVVTVVGTPPQVTAYVGLTRPDPWVTANTPGEFDASFSGSVTGGAGFPLPANHRVEMTLASDLGSSHSGTVDPATGAYTASVMWDFLPSSTVELTVVQWQNDVSGLPLTFTGAHTATIGVTDGNALIGPLPLTPVTTTTVSGTYTMPPGHTFTAKGTRVEGQSFALTAFDDDTNDTGTFSLKAPVIAGRPIVVAVNTVSPLGGGAAVAARNVAPGASGLVLQVPEAPAMLFPLDGTIDVDLDTVFFTTGFPAGVAIVQFIGVGPSSPDYLVVTDGTSVRIPDLSEFGIALPAGATYDVGITGIGPHASLDTFAGPPPTGGVPSPILQLAFSEQITVTTAP